jgi:hypothetical protein
MTRLGKVRSTIIILTLPYYDCRDGCRCCQGATADFERTEGNFIAVELIL